MKRPGCSWTASRARPLTGIIAWSHRWTRPGALTSRAGARFLSRALRDVILTSWACRWPDSARCWKNSVSMCYKSQNFKDGSCRRSPPPVLVPARGRGAPTDATRTTLLWMFACVLLLAGCVSEFNPATGREESLLYGDEKEKGL